MVLSMRRDANTRAGYPDAIVQLLLAALPRRGLIGISGLQGSGKSTLAAQLVAAAERRGTSAMALSIDDFYLGRRARQRLARAVHPLLITRGVPGTHDLPLLLRTLAALRVASPRQPARVPRFDKGRDTRLPPSRWRQVRRSPQLLILEGWCVGVPPQPASALRRPLNALERSHDADRTWRGFVNAELARLYVPLWRRLNRLVDLQAPNFAVVVRWRDEQERALRHRHAPRALSPAALRRFLMYYERLSRYALRTLPDRADICLRLDDRRNVLEIVID
jgi:D-glycerate 3-kinase